MTKTNNVNRSTGTSPIEEFESYSFVHDYELHGVFRCVPPGIATPVLSVEETCGSEQRKPQG
jgi:hypothetical protein